MHAQILVNFRNDRCVIEQASNNSLGAIPAHTIRRPRIPQNRVGKAINHLKTMSEDLRLSAKLWWNN